MVAVTWVTQPPTGQPASLPANLWRVQRDVPIGTALGGTVADTWSAPTIISRYSADGNDLALADGAVTTVKLALSSTAELTTVYIGDATDITANGEHTIATVRGTTGTGYTAILEGFGWFGVNSSRAASEPQIIVRLYRGGDKIATDAGKILTFRHPQNSFAVGSVVDDFSSGSGTFTVTAVISELNDTDIVLPADIRLSLLVVKR